MDAPLADLARQYRFNDATVQALCEGLEPRDWSRRPGDRGGNTAHWVLGHVAATRRRMLRKVGVDVPPAEWEGLFDARDPGDPERYPAIGDLRADLARTGERLSERLEDMSPDEAAQDWGTTFPDGGHTLEGGLRFLFFHEAWHLGQLSLLRRLAGKPGLV